MIPEVSFCVPVFNSGKNIERCLQAVLAQNVPSREILVVDNCSTDDTVAWARKILDGMAEARIVVNERNLGRIENWNRCLDLATGRYVRYGMANDLLLPGSTEILWQIAQKDPKIAMVCSRSLTVEEMPAKPEPMRRDAPAKHLETGDALQRFCKNGNDTGGLNSILMRREAVEQGKLRFDPKIPFWADFKFAVELAARGTVVYVEAESYLFDNNVKGRFTHAGLKNHSYYFEGRECALALGEQLAKNGGESWPAFEFLFRQYSGQNYNYGLKPLSVRETQALFAGAGPYLTKAMQYRRLLPLEKPINRLKRAAAKVGLYRYPWQKS